MKIMELDAYPSLARTLNRLEIMRSNLRWASQLDRDGVHKILRQMNELREEILMLSGVERYHQTLTQNGTPPEPSTGKRRQGLLDRRFKFDGVFGENENLLEAMETVEKAARTDLPILIQGESGTGKELLAQVAHASSDRADQPFLSVNCGAIVSTLLESELFGHIKGSFTGAIKDRKGKFEAAHNGTIFLDEIGELPHESQVKLLRVLETGDIQRVGSDEFIRVDARMIAATNRNLYQMVQEDKFREDLYYRLSVISVTLPPLRERRDELNLLIDYFAKEAAEKLNRSILRMTSRLRHFLLNHNYPGNIRELKNILYRLSCLADTVADLNHLPETIRPSLSNIQGEGLDDLSLDQARKAASDAAEKWFLEEHLKDVNGNVTALSKRLGISRPYLSTLLSKNSVKAADFKDRN